MKARLPSLRATATPLTQRGLRLLLHPLTLLLLAFSCNTLLWAAVTNIGNPPDEFSHFDYIRHLATNRALPIYGKTRYIDSQAFQAHASLPPLYYLLGTPVQMALGHLPITEQVLALRVLSVLLGAVTVALAYMLGRTLAPTRPAFALAVAVLVGFNPMFTYLSAAINSDNLNNLIFASLFLLLAQILGKQQLSRKWLIGWGSLIGLGLITKQTMIVGVLLSNVVVVLLAWRQRARFFSTFARYACWINGTALLISGWSFVRNWYLYGSVTGVLGGDRPDIYPTHPYRLAGSLWEMIFVARREFARFLPAVFRSFWGVFDHLEIPMPAAVYSVLTFFCAAGLVGAAIWAVRSWRLRKDSLTRQALLLVAAGALTFILALAGILTISYRIDYQPQGRYLFSALLPISIAIVVGWEELAGLFNLRCLVSPLVVVLAVTINFIALLVALAPAHHNRYLGMLLADKSLESDETYVGQQRYVPKPRGSSERVAQQVFNAAPGTTTFVAQRSDIERLEMLINVPPGARGPLIWRLSEQGFTDNLLAAIVQDPLAGPARYRLDVSSASFTPGRVYTIKLEAPSVAAQHPLVTPLSDNEMIGNLASDLTLQVDYSQASQRRSMLPPDHLLSDSPTSARGRMQRILFPLDVAILLVLVGVALAPLPLKRGARLFGLPILGLTIAVLVPVPQATGMFLASYDVAAAPDLPAAPTITSAPIYEGFHDVAGCHLISGWAWDANRPNIPVDVALYDEATLIATISANVFRPDLLQAGFGNGYHGFFYSVDGILKDGESHLIRVRFAGTDTDLLNTPKSINCSSVSSVTDINYVGSAGSARTRARANAPPQSPEPLPAERRLDLTLPEVIR